MPDTISDSRKRIVELAGEIAKDRPGIEEDAFMIRLHRALRWYTYQRREISTPADARIGLLIDPDPLEPELSEMPPEALKAYAEIALGYLNGRKMVVRLPADGPARIDGGSGHRPRKTATDLSRSEQRRNG